MRITSLLALVLALMVVGCQSPTSSDPKTPPVTAPPAAGGSVTLGNQTATGLTLWAYDPAKTTNTSDALITAPKVAAGQTATITGVPVDKDLVLKVVDDVPDKVTTYTLVDNAQPKLFHLSTHRAYNLDFSIDPADGTSMVWAWQLAANPAYEVSDLKVTPGTNSLTLTWKDPAMADLVSLSVKPVGGTAETVPKGIQTVTLGGLVAAVSKTVTVTAVYPEGSSRGVLISGTPKAPTVPVNPFVLSVAPPQGAKTVAVSPGTISATFNTDLDPASVTNSTFSLSDGSSPVQATLQVNGKVATLTPGAPLAYGKLHTATLSTGIKSISGGALASSFSWTFTTETSPVPTVVGTGPSAGASNQSIFPGTIWANFSTPLAAASVDTTTFQVSDGTKIIPGSVAVSGNSATFTPTTYLTPGKTLTVTLTTGIQGTTGFSLVSDYTWSFTTAAPVNTWVSNTTPTDKSVDFAVSPGKIELQFGTTLYEPSLNASTFVVSDPNGPIPGSVSAAGTFVTFTPNQALPEGQVITINLSTDIVSSTGGHLTAPYTWSFTTAFPPLFSRTLLTLGSMGSAGLAIGDVTGDGKADLVVVTDLISGNADKNQLQVYPQGASGLDSPAIYALASVKRDNTKGITIGDINGDGRNDVLVAETDRIQIFTQDGSGKLALSQTITTTASYDVRVADFNGDGRLDLAGMKQASTSISVWYQSVAGTLGSETKFTAGHGGYDAMAVGDTNGDGKSDLVIMSGQLNTYPNVQLLQQAASSFGTATGRSLSPFLLSAGVAVGDFTGDGKDDVAISSGGNSDGAVSIFPQSGGSIATSYQSYPSKDIPQTLLAVDVDGDGKEDLVVSHHGWAQVGVYLQKANGTLAVERLSSVGLNQSINPDLLASGDLNGDGKTDLAAVIDDGVALLYGL